MIDINLRQDTFAYQIIAACRAGLVLSGRNEEGEYEWLGTGSRYQEAEQIVEEYQNAK